MFNKIVVGVDGRAGGRDAVALARILAAPDARISLAHVHGHRAAVRTRAPDEAESRRLLETEREACDIDADVISVPADSIGQGLHQVADVAGADLLVVGSCSRGVAGRVLLGDDTRAALDGAPCAVAIAPSGYAGETRPFATVGVGYDGTRLGAEALGVAREIADARGAKLRVRQVVSIPLTPGAGYAGSAWGSAMVVEVEEAQRDLDRLPDVDAKAVLGMVNDELVSFSDSVDLLVIGARRYGPMHRFVLGTVAQYLAGHARCPLLALPLTPDPAQDSPATATAAGVSA